MTIDFTLDQILEIIAYYNGESNQLGEEIKAVADNELLLVKEYFESVLDQEVYLTNDYIRLRLFFIHWYAAFRTLLYYHKNLSDITYVNKQLLLESFGYFFYYLNDETTQEMLLYNLNKFYAYNGTPNTIISIIESVGILGYKLIEYLLTVEGNNLVFVPKAAFSNQTLNVYERAMFSLPYQEVVENDPHWYYTEEEIWDIIENNEDSLPAMTPYYGLVQAVNWFTDMRKAVMKIKRHIRKQIDIWINHGNLPDEIYFEYTPEAYKEYLSLVELYCAFVYMYKKHFSEDTTISNEAFHIAETQLPELTVYDNVLYIDEFDHFYYDRQSTRNERRQIIEERIPTWYTDSPNDYPLHTTDDYMNLLGTINPNLLDLINKHYDDFSLLTNLLNRIHYYCLVNYEIDAPFKYILEDDKITDDILSLVSYFKPYPSRLILFKHLFVFNDIPGDQFLIEDLIGKFVFNINLSDYAGFGYDPLHYMDLQDSSHWMLDYTIWDKISVYPVQILQDRAYFYNPYPMLLDPYHYNMIDFTIMDSFFFIINHNIKELFEPTEVLNIKNFTNTFKEYLGFDKDIRAMFDLRLREIIFQVLNIPTTEVITYVSLPRTDGSEIPVIYDKAIVEFFSILPRQISKDLFNIEEKIELIFINKKEEYKGQTVNTITMDNGFFDFTSHNVKQNFIDNFKTVNSDNNEKILDNGITIIQDNNEDVNIVIRDI